MMPGWLKALLWRVLPGAVRRRVRPGAVPPPEQIDWGDLRTTKPVSRWFGYDRGLPIDRYYIEGFLAARAADVHGRVLEIGDDSYTRRFGGERVVVRDVLHVSAAAPGATIIGDLANADHVASDSFDCIILTQTLHLIWDVPAAIRTLHRILAPGGVLLATVPGISPIDRGEWRDSWYWSFTHLSMTRLFAAHFPSADVSVEHHGNVLSATAFLQGVATRELRAAELDEVDDAYPVTIAVRAVKPGRP
jgi:SAM-dependent methyltransferase